MRFRRLPAAALLFTLSVIPAGSPAMTFAVDLPDLVGPFPSRYEAGPEASFDFGQGFIAVHGAWIEVEAHVTAEQFDVCGTFFDPQPCVHVVQLLGFYSRMDKEGSPIPGTVFSDGLTFSDDFRALEASGTATAPFNNPLVGWDFLLDGQGSLTVFWNDLLGDPDRIIMNVVEPTGEILGARLILDATPVPEPSTGTLILLGITMVASLRRLRTIRPRGRTTTPI